MRVSRARGMVSLATCVMAGCMSSVGGNAGEGPGPTGSDTAPGDPGLVPAGFGSLRQEDITLAFRAGDVQVRVTPLAEWVIRLTAPDTYRRLAATAARLEAVERLPVLVTFFTEAPGGVDVEPRDLELVNRGRRFRPERVQGLTAGWGQSRLEQGRPAQALYLFDGSVDLEMDLAVEFGGARSADWSSLVLPRLEAERARVRARAGGGLTPPGRTS